MAKIVIQGMAFHAYVGVYAHEQQEGNDCLVDVEMHSAAIRSENDDLTNTIDYGQVYAAVAQVMQNRYRLIETAAADILQSLRASGLPIENLMVRVTKLNPPLNGKVERVYVELHD